MYEIKVENKLKVVIMYGGRMQITEYVNIWQEHMATMYIV